MPQVRKLTPEEVASLERQARTPDWRRPPPDELPLRSYDSGEGEADGWGDSGAYLTLRPRPRVGDVLEVGASGDSGVVLAVRVGRLGAWTACEMLIDGGRYLVPAPAVGEPVGRPRGVSRIEHPARRTYGWFVRVGYAGMGKRARHTRFFSDRLHGGIAAALRAALAFRDAAERQR